MYIWASLSVLTHSTEWQLQMWSGLCTLCTCCGFHYESRNAARFQSSSPSEEFSREPATEPQTKSQWVPHINLLANITSCHRALMTYQTTVYSLSWSLLHLPQLWDEVPETRLSHNMVGGKNPHTIQRRGRVLGRGQQTPNDFIFPKLQQGNVEVVRQIFWYWSSINNFSGFSCLLNLGFTFKGTAASEKGDKDHLLSAPQKRSHHWERHELGLWVQKHTNNKNNGNIRDGTDYFSDYLKDYIHPG